MVTSNDATRINQATVTSTLTCLIVLAVSLAISAVGEPKQGSTANPNDVNISPRGEYMTMLLGCGGCHTEGALEGNPYGPPLAGSQIGIGYTDSLGELSPGIVFPGNLTPDRATGLGRWDRDDIVSAIRTGASHSEERLSSVMPWANYSQLTIEDTIAIADYLQSLSAIQREIPESVKPGSANRFPYIRIGIYRFEPATDSQPPEAGN